jgi:polyisoprenoid-binding protein YceI
MKSALVLLLALGSLNSTSVAATQTFDFKDPKGVNNAVFKLDAPLEAISGNATGVSGTVNFDPENPAATHGKIVVAASSLHVGNPMQQQHLLSDKWMDAAKYPEISFEAKDLKNVKTSGDVTTADVTGTFTLEGNHGAREIHLPQRQAGPACSEYEGRPAGHPLQLHS